MIDAFPTRRFEVWDYNVSHAQLLLRSVGRAGNTNIDIIFSGVRYLALRTDFDGFELIDPTESDLRRAAQECGAPVEPSEVFAMIDSRGHRGLIVADALRVVPNELEMFETSLEQFSDPRARAEEYERAVVQALSVALPTARLEWGVKAGKDLGVDVLIEEDGRFVAVEAKYLRGQDRNRAVRRTVMDLVSHLDWDQQRGILVLVAADEPDELVGSLTDHLTSAIGASTAFRVVAWTPGEPVQKMSSAVRSLISM